jgi:hypothetical protein
MNIASLMAEFFSKDKRKGGTLFLIFQPQFQQGNRIFAQVRPGPVFLTGSYQFPHTVQDMPVAQIFKLTDTFLEGFVKGHL